MNNNEGLSVTYAGLDQASAGLDAEAKALDTDLADLRALVVKSKDSWEGEAQASFGEKLAKWDKEANDIHQALTGITSVVRQASGDYQGGDKKASSLFQ